MMGLMMRLWLIEMSGQRPDDGTAWTKDGGAEGEAPWQRALRGDSYDASIVR